MTPHTHSYAHVNEAPRWGTPKPIPADLADSLAYDKETGILTWRVPAMRGRIAAGSVAGSEKPQSPGYRVINWKKKLYLTHRIAWFIATGEQPPAIIDHRDGDPRNMRWDNLRAATPSLNSANARPHSKTLKKGTARYRDGRFTAGIVIAGKRYHLGIFDTEDEAHRAYLTRAKDVFGEFARAG